MSRIVVGANENIRPGRLLTGLIRPPVGPLALIYDTFTAPNGTTLDAHTPDIAPAGVTGYFNGSAWNIWDGTAGMPGVIAAITKANVPIGDWTKDVFLEAECDVPAAASGLDPVAFGVAVRCSTTDRACWTAYVDRTGAGATYQLNIFEVTGGGQTLRGQVAGTGFTGGAVCRVSARTNGDVLTARAVLGGIESEVSVTMNTLSANRDVGITSYRDATYKRASHLWFRATKAS